MLKHPASSDESHRWSGLQPRGVTVLHGMSSSFLGHLQGLGEPLGFLC